MKKAICIFTLSLAACAPEATESPPATNQSTAPDLVIADQVRICKAAIEAMNGHPASQMQVFDNQQDFPGITYTRADGQNFGFDCRPSDGRVHIRDDGSVRWWATAQITYELRDGAVLIGVGYAGEQPIMAEVAI